MDPLEEIIKAIDNVRKKIEKQIKEEEVKKVEHTFVRWETEGDEPGEPVEFFKEIFEEKFIPFYKRRKRRD